MSETRHYNFNPGPSTLPLQALKQAQAELIDFQGSGMSILEHSHRGKVYEAVHAEAIALLTELYQIPDTHQVLFMHGGASAQFALIPMNLRTDSHAGDYVITGSWSKKALGEAKVVGQPHVAWDKEADASYVRVPKSSELSLSADAPYVHITTNNTIAGTQFHALPDTGKTPMVLDASSDVMSTPIDFTNVAMLYAGAQKNLGPSGLTVVIIRKDQLERCRTEGVPKIFRYPEIAAANSLQNTIPTFAVYLIRNVLTWVKEQGGVAEMAKRNAAKAQRLYAAIEGSNGFYRCPVESDSRSYMNVVFRLPDEDAEKRFVAEATEAGLVGLKGHRSVGGIRASLYNAMSMEGVEKLVAFMAAFQAKA